jgi:hypothetical protein
MDTVAIALNAFMKSRRVVRLLLGARIGVPLAISLTRTGITGLESSASLCGIQRTIKEDAERDEMGWSKV